MDSKLVVNKTYYYKVRVYRVVDGKNVYGGYSTVASVKVKKFPLGYCGFGCCEVKWKIRVNMTNMWGIGSLDM